MKKLDNRGFTLVELLATLAVLSLVSTIVIYVAINVVNSAKDKSYLVTINNVEDAAVSYLRENSDKVRFVKYDDDLEYQCITVQNLIDTNYFDKDVLNSKISKDKTISGNNYIYIKRDINSKTVKDSKLIIDSNSDYNTLCGKASLYGTIDFVISPSGFAREKNVDIKYCLYNVSDYKNVEYFSQYNDLIYNDGNSDNTFGDNCLIRKVTVNENGDMIAKILKRNTDGNKEEVKSAIAKVSSIDNKAPVIKIEPNGDNTYTKSKTININISDDLSGISSDSTIKYGFSKSKSEEPSSYKEVKVKGNVEITEGSLTGEYYLWVKPSVKDNAGNVNNDTLISDVYKFDNTAPSIPTYIAKYRDGSGDYTSGSNANKEVVTEISTNEADSGVEGIYYSKDKNSKTKFNFGVSALTQNGNTWNGTESWDFRNGRNDSYYFMACDKVGNCSEWSGVFNIKYLTSVYIKYNANSGSLVENNHGSNYGVNEDGMITKNGNILTTKINYQGKLGSNGLYNTKNSKAVNLTNGSYSIFSGREWCTKSDGSGTCYDQTTQYSASDFCDISSNDCEVILYANWLSYYCSYTNVSYPTKSEAIKACTVTSTENVVTTTTTTYSCPPEYTCSGGTCTKDSKCEKKVTGTISTKYYCSHNKTYQTSSTCSYMSGGYYSDYYDLKCVNDTCTYSCPDGGKLKGEKCYKNDKVYRETKTECKGWNVEANGKCDYSCRYASGLQYSKCRVNYGDCKSNSVNYSCISTCGSGDGENCKSGIVISGSNSRAQCQTNWKYYTCSKNATKSCNKVYKAAKSKSRTETNGSCDPGYTPSRVSTCSETITWGGKKYCDTRDYFDGKSCKSNAEAVKREDMKCTKTGELRYYCSLTDKYTTSKPSCTDTKTENLISTTTTSYSCPTGYDSTGNLDKNSVCTKTVVYDVY